MADDVRESLRATLDPEDWSALRAQGHVMLDDMFDFLEQLRQRPVWQPIPQTVRDGFHEPLPTGPTELDALHRRFIEDILPYGAGNVHPGFMGWVNGGGTPIGMLAEMLAAGLNANLGGRDHIPIAVERQVVEWVRAIFGFPAAATGLFVTGTSTANLIAVLVARTAALGVDVRTRGLGEHRLVAYASAGAHICIAKAMDIAGLGSASLRLVPMNQRFEMDVAALERAIADDLRAGLKPFFVAGTAGTVDVGAIDDLAAISRLCRARRLWFHVDGAYGALAMLAPELAPRFRGIEQADSIAFDFHKWGQVPYDAGFVLVRDGKLHRDSFAAAPSYLKREDRGLAAGSPWPCDFGPDLSRGFRALKTWFTLKFYGTERLGQMIANSCELAQYLKRRIEASPALELLAPVALNIVCFRYRCSDEMDANRVNAAIVVALQESGVAAPSSTTLDGRLAIRAAIVNHRTEARDIDALVEAAIAWGGSETLKLGKTS